MGVRLSLLLWVLPRFIFPGGVHPWLAAWNLHFHWLLDLPSPLHCSGSSVCPSTPESSLGSLLAWAGTPTRSLSDSGGLWCRSQGLLHKLHLWLRILLGYLVGVALLLLHSRWALFLLSALFLRQLLLLFVEVRPGRKLQDPSLSAPRGCYLKLAAWVVIWTTLKAGFAELGWQASGPERSYQTGWDHPIGQSKFERGQGCTWCSEPKVFNPLGALELPLPIGIAWDLSAIPLRSHIPFLPRRKQEPIVKELVSLTQVFRSNGGCGSYFRRPGTCGSGKGCICVRVEFRGRGGWYKGSLCNGHFEEGRWLPASHSRRLPIYRGSDRGCRGCGLGIGSVCVPSGDSFGCRRWCRSSHWRGGACGGGRYGSGNSAIYEACRGVRGGCNAFSSRRSFRFSLWRRVGCKVASLASGGFASFRGLVCTRGHSRQRGQHPKEPKSSSAKAKAGSRWGYRFRRSSKTKEAHNRFVGRECADGDGHFASSLPADEGAHGQAAHHGGSAEEKSVPGCSSESTSFLVLGRRFSGGFSSKSIWIPPQSTEDESGFGALLWRRSGKGTGIGSAQRGASAGGHGTGHFGPVDSAEFPCRNLGGGPAGSHARSSRSNNGDKRGSGQSQTSSRVGSAEGHFLSFSGSSNEQEDDAYVFDGPALSSASPTRSDGHPLSGEVWRLWEAEGVGADPVPTDDYAGLCHGGELGGLEGHPGPFDSDGGASLPRLRSLRPGSTIDVAGRSTCGGVHKSSTLAGISSKGILAIGRSEVDHGGFGISEGARHDCGEEVGDPRRKGFWKWRRSYLETRSQAKARSKEEGKRKRKRCQRGGDGGAVSSVHNEPVLNHIDSTLTFLKWAICLPRWVLATRNDYAWHLARSFSVEWHGPTMRSTVFPLPVPFPKCFGGSGPQLSRSRMKVVALKRLVHLIVVALNYMHLGRFATLQELGRFPNGHQLACFRRLYNYVAVCGYRSEPLPVVPGRAGAELISCMDTLERYLVEHGDFAGGYGGERRTPFVPRREDEDEKAVSYPQLKPYRALDPDRLRISGRGRWPLADYLEGVLWLPFVEPAILRHHQDVSGCPMPSFAGERRSDYLKLAGRWDALGLLRLHEDDGEVGYCKIFNTWKNKEQDRQIGDRRAVNAQECSISGPSSRLPSGPTLLNLHCLRGECIRGSVTDRRDFYHQVYVTRSRSATNMVPFSFTREELGGLSALEQFDESVQVGAFDRMIHGDRYGKEPLRKGQPSELHPAFGALYQGDHLGVEFALAGHESLLQREGLLVEDERLQSQSALPLGVTWQGLIIDDFFVISAQPVSRPVEKCDAFLHLVKAREAYERHSLPGSPEKDVVAALTFKAAGAEVDAAKEVTSRGMCTVGAPLQKRLGLGLLSLRLASLDGISSRVAARVSGSWVSVLLYRRCISSVVDDLFALGARYEEEGEDVMLPLSRRVSQELTFLAVLSPIAVSDVASPFSRTVYATDSSMEKGAIVETKVSSDLAKGLWLGGDKRGCYTKLQNPFRAVRRQVFRGIDEDLLDDNSDGEGLEVLASGVQKGIPFFFDFVEVCGGVGAVSHAMDLLGFSVAPVLDLSDSSHYDLKDLRLLEWIYHMLEQNRFRSVMLEPPCTTFSPAAHPAVRSYECPTGFNRKLTKVWVGNRLAFGSFSIMMVAKRNRRPSLMEQPRLSKMCWLSIWKWLRAHGCEEFVCASCMFKSIHRKEFRLLSFGLPADEMDVRCCGGHQHVRIEGRYTRGSAVYTPDLAMHFARGFAKGLRKVRREDAEGEVDASRKKESRSMISCQVEDGRRWGPGSGKVAPT